MTVVLVIVAVVLLVAGTVVLIRRRPPATGVEGFRRHIDALSPEARREVMDRVRNNAAANRNEGAKNGRSAEQPAARPDDAGDDKKTES
jgi:uncharacterized membrane protein